VGVAGVEEPGGALHSGRHGGALAGVEEEHHAGGARLSWRSPTPALMSTEVLWPGTASGQIVRWTKWLAGERQACYAGVRGKIFNRHRRVGVGGGGLLSYDSLICTLID
jgi:hypothetical protein